MSQRNLGRRRLDVVSPQRPFTSTGAHCFASPTRRVLRAGQVSQIFVDGRQFFIIHSSERVTRNGRICGRFYPAISVRRLGSHLPQAGRSGRSAWRRYRATYFVRSSPMRRWYVHWPKGARSRRRACGKATLHGPYSSLCTASPLRRLNIQEEVIHLDCCALSDLAFVACTLGWPSQAAH